MVSNTEHTEHGGMHMAEKNYLECFEPFIYEDEFVTVPYRLFEPKTIPGERYPLVVFLHGAGERGNDNQAQITANEGATIWASDEVQEKHPCFVLAPQCPADGYWGVSIRTTSTDEFRPNSLLATVSIIVDIICDKHPIDLDRIYVTGLSMGGFGTISLLMLHPCKFTAAVVVCGGGNMMKLDMIKHIPLWLFHAVDDNIVPIEYSRRIAEVLTQLGGTIRYTEYPKGYMASLGFSPHASWIPAYRTKEMIEWLFHQKKTACSGL